METPSIAHPTTYRRQNTITVLKPKRSDESPPALSKAPVAFDECFLAPLYDRREFSIGLRDTRSTQLNVQR